MARFLGALLAMFVFQNSVLAQTFTDYGAYCDAMAEVASPTLQARASGISKAQAASLMNGMTDPQAIRMVNEVLDFAYSKPVGTTVEAMRSELKILCRQKKVFVQ
jgi:hypothetical protein